MFPAGAQGGGSGLSAPGLDVFPAEEVRGVICLALGSPSSEMSTSLFLHKDALTGLITS